MNAFLRAVERRVLAEREERVATTTPPPETEPVYRRRGYCECGQVALLRQKECRLCREARVADELGRRRGRYVRRGHVEAIVRRYPLGVTIADMMRETGLNRSATYRAMSRGVAGGYLQRVEQGRYALAVRQ